MDWCFDTHILCHVCETMGVWWSLSTQQLQAGNHRMATNRACRSGQRACKHGISGIKQLRMLLFNQHNGENCARLSNRVGPGGGYASADVLKLFTAVQRLRAALCGTTPTFVLHPIGAACAGSVQCQRKVACCFWCQALCIAAGTQCCQGAP